MKSQTEKSGLVYILTNESFREDWVKIGKSTRPVGIRLKELDNTAVPLPFNIYATLETSKYNEVERLVHKTIDRLTDLRIRQNREFFNVPPEVALDIFRDIAQTIDDAHTTVYRNNVPVREEDQAVSKGEAEKDIAEHAPRRKPFRFSLAKIEIGEKITFIPTGTEVRVADDKKVEYEGRLYTLSAFVGTFLPEEQQNESGAYQGPLYFSYRGERISERRKRLESEASPDLTDNTEDCDDGDA